MLHWGLMLWLVIKNVINLKREIPFAIITLLIASGILYIIVADVLVEMVPVC